MEGCCGCHYWDQSAESFGNEVRIINPKKVKGYLEGHKIDHNDALAIANASIQIGIKYSQPKSLEQQSMLSLESSRRFLSRSVVSLGQHIRGTILGYGIANPRGEKGLKASVQAVLDGETSIPEHYPPIISKELFFATQNQIASRNNRSAGYRKSRMKNLFSGLMRCAECGAPLTVPQKNSKALIERYGEKNYLSCSRKVENRCGAKAIRYEPFEEAMCYALSLLPSIIEKTTGRDDKVRSLKGEFACAESELRVAEERGTRLAALLLDRPDSQSLLPQLDVIDADVKKKKERIAEISTAIERSIGSSCITAKAIESFELSSRPQLTSDFDTRVAYNAQINGLLDSISVDLGKKVVSAKIAGNDGKGICGLMFFRDMDAWYIHSNAGGICIALKGDGNIVPPEAEEAGLALFKSLSDGYGTSVL